MVSISNINLEANIIQHYYPDDDLKTLFKKFLKLIFIVHRRNPRSRYYLKSDARIKQEILRQLNEAPYIISPFSIYRLIWERIMLFIWGSLFFLTPVYSIILYDEKFPVTSIWFWFDSLLNIVCFVDVIQNLFTGFYDSNSNVIVIEQKVIIIRYMKFYFWIDVISSIPYKSLIWHLRSVCPKNRICDMDYIPVLGNLKLFRFRTVFKTCDQLRLNLSHFACKSIRIVLVIVCSLHWLTTLDYLINRIFQDHPTPTDFSMYRNDESNFHILSLTFWNEPRGTQYVKLLHRTIFITTLFSHDTPKQIAFNDIIFTIILTFLGLYTRIYLIAQVLLYIGTFQTSMKLHQLRATLQRYMRFRQIPYNIQSRFIEYYDYRLQQRCYRETKILNNISNYLKEEIILQSCRRLVKTLPLFEHLPEHLLPTLFSNLTTEIFLKNDIIIRAGQVGTTMYFIVNGTVAVYTSSGKELVHLKDGDHFGEIGLFSDSNIRTANVIAVETCDLLALNRSNFLKCLAPFPELLEKLQDVSRKRLKAIIDEV